MPSPPQRQTRKHRDSRSACATPFPRPSHGQYGHCSLALSPLNGRVHDNEASGAGFKTFPEAGVVPAARVGDALGSLRREGRPWRAFLALAALRDMAAAGTRSLAIRDAVAKMNGTAALREQAGHCRETGPHSMSCTSGRRAGRSRQSDAANARRASRPQDRFARELSFFAETGADPLPKLQFSSSRGASAWSITHDCGPGAAARAGNPDKTRNLPSADRTAFGAKAANGHACHASRDLRLRSPEARAQCSGGRGLGGPARRLLGLADTNAAPEGPSTGPERPRKALLDSVRRSA